MLLRRQASGEIQGRSAATCRRPRRARRPPACFPNSGNFILQRACQDQGDLTVTRTEAAKSRALPIRLVSTPGWSTAAWPVEYLTTYSRASDGRRAAQGLYRRRGRFSVWSGFAPPSPTGRGPCATAVEPGKHGRSIQRNAQLAIRQTHRQNHRHYFVYFSCIQLIMHI